jgi:hypothetical protein
MGSSSSSSSSSSYAQQSTVWAPPLTQQRIKSQAVAETKADTKPTQQQRRQRLFKVYCDLDGVLVDFEHGIRSLFPDLLSSSIQLQELERSKMWKRVAAADAFFERLPWAPGGRRLWQAIRHLEPDILTGVPVAHASSRREKYAWCRRELGLTHKKVSHVDMAGRRWNHASVNGARKQDTMCNVITCWSNNKHYESGPGAVLIDDREALRHAWEAKGGIFVHHQTGNVDRTLEQLRQYGVLSSDDDVDEDEDEGYHGDLHMMP